MFQTNISIEIPCLSVAFEGYSPAQVSQLKTWLDEAKSSQDPGGVRWSMTDSLSCADLVLQPEYFQRDTSARHLQAQTRLLVKVFRWPDTIDSIESLNMAKQRLLLTLLEHEPHLKMSCMRYVLASQLMERYVTKDKLSGLWHVSAAGVLLAVVDFNRLQVSFRPDAHYLEFDEAIWEHRSPHAMAPKVFVTSALELMIWDYLRRTYRSLLPTRLLRQPLYLRRMPRIPMAFMSEQELSAVMVLKKRSMTWLELGKGLGLTSLQTKSLLSCLYFNGAVTTRQLTWWQQFVQILGVNSSRLFRDADSSLHDNEGDYEPSSVFVLEAKKRSMS